MMPRDVSTRWNSTYDMLDFAVNYRAALDTITCEREMKLRQFELSEEDWDAAIHLRDVLKVCTQILLFFFTNPIFQIFKDATLFFSRGTPNLTMVIPVMDIIDDHLATAATNDDYPLALKAALAVSKKTLNRYYNKTDDAEVFRIAMGIFIVSCYCFHIINFFLSVLHPGRKLEYFEEAGWTKDWIDTARDIVVTEYKRSYASRDIINDIGDVVPPPTAVGLPFITFSIILMNHLLFINLAAIDLRVEKHVRRSPHTHCKEGPTR
jgi:hypothetical protein